MIRIVALVSLISFLLSVPAVGFADEPPAVTAPATFLIPEMGTRSFTVTASDPDGDPILSLSGSGLPFSRGATFAVNATNTTGTFTWTPDFTSAGIYTVTFTASNALSGSATTQVTVCNSCDRAPVVMAPAQVSVERGSTLVFSVAATDPDGDAIISLTAASLPSGASFTTNSTNVSGTFFWTPSFTQAGTYNVTFTASNTLSGSAITQITVTSGCSPPSISAPASVSGQEGSTLRFDVTAVDPAGLPITSLTAAQMPAGATLTTNASNTSGTFTWTPTCNNAGTYAVTITACSECGCNSATITITIQDVPTTPVIAAPTTVTAFAGDALAFPVNAVACATIPSLSASGLPSGADFFIDPLTGAGTFRWTPTDDQAGTYSVTFSATANSLTTTHVTSITVVGQAAGRAFVTSSNRMIHLSSGKPQWCSAVEPIQASFEVQGVVLSSVVLSSPGTGSVSQISARTGKTVVVGDADKNDVDDITFCFAKEDLRLLFSGVSGRTTVPVSIEGDLVTGGSFRAPLSVDVIGTGGHAASIRPNPLNPSGLLSFETARPGIIRIRLFDADGQLVRELPEAHVSDGRHDFRIEARDERGRTLTSGVYFYQVELGDERWTGRFCVLK